MPNGPRFRNLVGSRSREEPSRSLQSPRRTAAPFADGSDLRARKPRPVRVLPYRASRGIRSRRGSDRALRGQAGPPSSSSLPAPPPPPPPPPRKRPPPPHPPPSSP